MEDWRILDKGYSLKTFIILVQFLYNSLTLKYDLEYNNEHLLTEVGENELISLVQTWLKLSVIGETAL